MLHEGLGSVAMWKDFPHRVAQATGRDVVAYSRAGYGRSSPAALPVRRPLHARRGAGRAAAAARRAGDRRDRCCSATATAASIALIHAAASRAAGRRARADGAARAGRGRLDRQHRRGEGRVADDRPARAARALPRRRRRRLHRLERHLAASGFPRLEHRGLRARRHLPGAGDPGARTTSTARLDQVRRIARAAPDVELVELADCRHSPHRDQPDAVLAALARFVDRLEL